jgi:prevent-host-death family protein
MIKVKLEEAEGHLEQLIDEVAGGEDVIITNRKGRDFRIIPLGEPTPHPRFGSAKGLIKIAEDFDEPLEDFKDYELRGASTSCE